MWHTFNKIDIKYYIHCGLQRVLKPPPHAVTSTDLNCLQDTNRLISQDFEMEKRVF